MLAAELDLLRPFATVRQVEVLTALVEHNGLRPAARALGIHHAAVGKVVRAVRKRAALQGVSPAHGMVHAVPEPFVVRGTSTLYDADGNARLQWVKTRLDGEMLQDAMREAIEALAEAMPRATPIPAPRAARQDLCNLYTLTDCHVGMRAWKPETGGNWDLDIAERILTAACDALFAAAPIADTGIVCQLGDFLHFDSLLPVTPSHGHVLDGDGRYSKVVRVAVRILRRVIDRALALHRRVIVVMAEGNHDQASSVWLRHLFALLYENEPRVTVIDTETPYYVYQHGRTMLAFHHGHLTRNAALPLLFAAQFPEMWGATNKRYCHTGHRHHAEEKEHPGMKIVQHPTLAARDAHAARGGWISERQVSAITYHDQHGEAARVTVTPEMLEVAQ